MEQVALDKGTTVIWDFHGFPGASPIYVKQVIMNEMIVLEWDNNEGTKNLVEIKFEPLITESTLVKIRESGWKNEDLKSLDVSYGNSFGWLHMLCGLKVYLEYGKNLREIFLSSSSIFLIST